MPPNEFLATFHDRTPMVLHAHLTMLGLKAGPAAPSLVGVHPDAEAFEVKPV